MDKTRFLFACQACVGRERTQNGIGTLGEKSVHAALKHYFDPCEAHHEVRFGDYVADVKNEQGFVEIQTRDFYRMQKKLEIFLQEAPVTVVYPVTAERWLLWIDENGELEPKRKVTRKPTAASILPELYGLRSLLQNPRLRFCVVLLEVEDYRFKDGYGPDRKKRATKFDRYPVALLDELWLSCPEDYLRLVPDSLEDGFSAKEYAKAVKLPMRQASAAANVLSAVGAVERIGKEKNAYLYRRKQPTEASGSHTGR